MQRYSSVQSFLTKLSFGDKLVIASQMTAAEFYRGKSGAYYSKKIREWTRFYMLHLHLPPVCQGMHQKVKPLLCENDVKDQCRSFLRGLKPDKISLHVFKTFLEKELFPGRNVSESTVRRCFHDLGYSFTRIKKGMYIDGHERDDVIQYRGEFLKNIFYYETFMEKYSGDFMDIVEQPTFPPGGKRHVLVVHDESLFYANDGQSSMWVHPKHPPLRKKGKGKCIMISEFLCECHGRMSLSHELDEPQFATEVITPGKNDDGWWTAPDLLQQFTQKAIPIFERLHPDCVAVFLFDNSTNHGAFAEDALNVNKMNLNTGGKQPSLRNGYFEREGCRVEQELVFPAGHSQGGVPKGVKRVLQERNLWTEGMKLADARAKLAEQPDFVQQKTMLEENADVLGHVVLFVPKFHCELNFIEMYWGGLKYFCRNNCDYSFKTLLPTVHRAMDSISLGTIRRYARKCWRYMDAYHQGLSLQQAEWAAKKQRSHRRVSMSLVPKDL